MENARLPNPRLLVLAALAILAVGLGIAAAVGAFSSGSSGGEVPTGAVAADVDGHPITVERARRLMLAYVRLSLGAEASIPASPGYTACVATQRTRAPNDTEAQLKEACAQLYASVKRSALEALVRASWLELVAGREGVRVTEREAERALRKDLEAEGLRATTQVNAFIASQKAAGTLREALVRIRQTLLENKLHERVAAHVPPVTEAEARAYYQAQPELTKSWDFLIIRSRRGEDPGKIKQQLANGSSWATVVEHEAEDATEYGEEPRHEDEHTGEVKKAIPSELTPQLTAALKSANVGELVGPIPAKRGAYIFKITKVNKQPRPSFAATKSKIAAMLQREREDTAFATFTKNSEAHYRARTSCSRGWVYPSICG